MECTEQQANKENNMYQYKAKVLKVLDGDTVDIDLEIGRAHV